jgi:DNA gyrase subunit A
MIATAGGQACRFNEKELRPMGRATKGVIGIRLKNKNDAVVALTVVDITGSLFTITENGFGKRSPIDEYRMTHRGSKGVRTIVTNERNGNVVFVSQVTDENELIITTEHGMTVRIAVRDIREQGRNTMGVRIMRLNEGDKVVSVTITKMLPENGVKCEIAAVEQIPIGMIAEQPQKEEPAAPVEEAEELPKEVEESFPVVKPAEPEKTVKKPEESRKIEKQKKEKVKMVPLIKGKGKTLKIKKTASAKKKPVKKKKIKPVKKPKAVKPRKVKTKPVKKPKKSKPVKKVKVVKTKKTQTKKISDKKKPKRK